MRWKAGPENRSIGNVRWSTSSHPCMEQGVASDAGNNGCYFLFFSLCGVFSGLVGAGVVLDFLNDQFLHRSNVRDLSRQGWNFPLLGAAAGFQISMGGPMNFLFPTYLKSGGRVDNNIPPLDTNRQLKYQFHFCIVRVWGVCMAMVQDGT